MNSDPTEYWKLKDPSVLVPVGSVWTNKKNHEDYQVMAMATHTETREMMVCYFDTVSREWYVRPLELFLEKFSWRYNP